jgi:Ca-activated chloride channel family protein
MNIKIGALCLLLFFLILFVAGSLWADPYTSVMRKGVRYYNNELYREALGFFQQGMEKNEKSTAPYFNTGAALYKMEDYVASIESLTASLERTRDDKETAQIHYNLGNNHFQIGNYDKAVEHYTQALEKDPYNLNSKFNLELALKKLSGQSAPSQEETEEDKGEGGPEQTENESRDDADHKGSEGEQEQTGDDFSREEAERLVDSVNNDQSRIINEIIQNRAGRVQHEKDW